MFGGLVSDDSRSRSSPLAQDLIVLRFLRILWASPCSLVGLSIGALVLLFGGSVRRVGCALEFAPYHGRCPSNSRLRFLPFSAITFGHVILGHSFQDLVTLRAHELVHVRQYERLGPLFFIAYPASSLLAAARGRCPYRNNHFEMEACARSTAPKVSSVSPVGEGSKAA